MRKPQILIQCAVFSREKELKMDYKKAGVDIEAGYKSVELMKEHVKRTMREEVLGGLFKILINTICNAVYHLLLCLLLLHLFIFGLICHKSHLYQCHWNLTPVCSCKIVTF